MGLTVTNYEAPLAMVVPCAKSHAGAPERHNQFAGDNEFVSGFRAGYKFVSSAVPHAGRIFYEVRNLVPVPVSCCHETSD